MKIAISSTGDTLDSPVDPRFGRAARFIVYDTDAASFDVVNPGGGDAAQGAGLYTAQAVSRLGVEWVITGHCGPKAFQALQAAGIRVSLVAEGSVARAIDEAKAGRLSPAQSADVGSHWG